MTLTRRLAALEAARTTAARAAFRGAFHAWVARPRRAGRPASREEAEARVAELRAALSPAARAESDRLHAALVALIEPATPPAGVVQAAGVIAETGEFGLAPGTPPYLVLEALAAHFRQPDD